jgi:ribosome-binding protein aMBF1 (putative translation factor)
MIMAAKKTFDSEALQYTFEKYIGNNREQVAAYEQESANIDVAKLIYNLRTRAGLSQRELAKKVDTTASVICRLEDADYEGHSLSMLKRIAAALEQRLEIRTVPIRKRASSKGAEIHQVRKKSGSRR